MFEGALQPIHWLVVLGIFMVFFGGKRLPESARGLATQSAASNRECERTARPRRRLPPRSCRLRIDTMTE